MRSVVIKGIDTGFRKEMYGEVGLICAVMEIATRGGDLVYEADLSGKEVVKLASPFNKDLSEIEPNRTYTITAYDW